LRLRRATLSLGLAGGIASAALLAACGGGSSSVPTVGPTPTPASTASPTPSATPTPAPSSTTLPLPTSAGTLTLPTLGGFGVTFQIAAGAPAGTTVTATGSLGAPANAPAPSSARRLNAIAGATNVFYVTLTVSQTISAQVFTGENLTVPSTPSAGAQYFAEVDDITSAPGTKIGSFGPATLAGLVEQITNNCTCSPSPTLTTGRTYLFQFYYTTSTATPTPTPTPTSSASATATPTATGTPTTTATPTPTPTATASVKPDFAFNGAAAAPQTFTSTGGGPISAGPDQGVTVSTTWGANNATSSFTFTENLAAGSSEITPNTFPVYTPATGQHVVIYMKFTATPAVTFTKTPDGTITVPSASTFGGTACALYSLNGGGGSAYSWQAAITGLTPSGNTLTLTAQTLPPPSTVDVGNPSNGNSVYLALVCQ
jgi:hypothetical protein